MQKTSSRLGILVRSAGDVLPSWRSSLMCRTLPPRDSTTSRMVVSSDCKVEKGGQRTGSPRDFSSQQKARTSSSHLPS